MFQLFKCQDQRRLRLTLYLPLQEAAGRVCLKERGRDVLVLRRVTSAVTSPSDRPSPTSSGGGSREDDFDKRSAPPTTL